MDDSGPGGDRVRVERPVCCGTERPSGERHEQTGGGIEHGEHVGPSGLQPRHRLLLLVRIARPCPEPVRDGGALEADRPDARYAGGAGPVREPTRLPP